MEEVNAGHVSEDGIYRDFCDGTVLQNHLMNQEMLQLSFYFDKLEVANPLGSKRGKHKLGKDYVKVKPHLLVTPTNNFPASYEVCTLGLSFKSVP